MKAARLLLGFSLISLLLSSLVTAKEVSTAGTIAFFSPRSPDDIFWGQFTGFMKEAVDDLGMNLKIYYANGNHVKMVEQAAQSLKEDNPSILVFQNFKKQGKVILDLAEAAHVPSFIVNAGFTERDSMGKPREKYKYWIGEMVPNDEEAGYALADLLIRNAPRSPDGRIHMVALTGNIADSASTERQKGLERALRQSPRVILRQIFSTDWSSEMARMKFNLIKKSRYPETTVVWAAGDAVALGVIEGAKELNLRMGRDIITGGVDWSAQGLRSVIAGEMTVSLGGHYMEGAWVTVLIYDYLHGKDFISESVKMRSPMSAITKTNAELYVGKLSRENWSRIDFKKFSKHLNPGIHQYNFTVQSILNQIQ